MSKLSQNETNIVKAIESGSNTVELISEKTKLSINVVHLLCGSLCKNLILRRNPNDKTFSIVDPTQNRKVTICYGDLLQPVKFFVSKSGQRYAIRGGTWNPVDNDTSADDIEWIDDSESMETNKSNAKPKDRSALLKPTVKIIEVSDYDKWLTQPLGDTKAESYIMENGNYRIKLEVLETRGEYTEVKAMIKIGVGKVNLTMYPTLKPETLINTNTLTDFIKGKIDFPFTIDDFIWKDMKKVVYFPISIKIGRDSSCEAEMITFTKTKPKNDMQWMLYTLKCGAQSISPRFLKGDAGNGSLQDAISKHKITSFIKGLQGFKVKK